MSRSKKLYNFQSAPYRNFYKIKEYEELAIHSKSYFDAATELYKIENRFMQWWLPAYYLIFHAIELGMKSLISKNGRNVPENHRLVDSLYSSNKDIFKFIDIKPLESIVKINDGKGQLRYPNVRKKEFYPNIFEDCSDLMEKLLDEIDK